MSKLLFGAITFGLELHVPDKTDLGLKAQIKLALWPRASKDRLEEMHKGPILLNPS